MKANLTLRMYLKATRPNKAGMLPIYARITINGERLEFTTKKYVDPKKNGISAACEQKETPKKPEH